MAQPLTQPNFLWITLEDTSPRFGCYGDPVAQTPHIDRLAADGCRYERAFSTAAVCAPSRFAVITGCYAHALGAHHMRTTHQNRASPDMPTPYEVVPPAYVRLIPEYLRAAGYYCTNNSKTDYQFTAPPTAWDRLGTDAHWRGRDCPDQPFMAVFNFTATHESGMWDPEDRGGAAAAATVTDPANLIVPPYLPDTPRVRSAIARQYDNLAFNDELVGRVLAELEEDGLAENTVVMLWSDHGEGLPRAKRWPYDQGIRVPLIVRGPGLTTPEAVSSDLVSMIDLGPTVLSLAGIPLPRHMHGQPFLGPARRSRQYVYAHRDRHDEAYDMVRAVRDDRFKYIRNFYPDRPYLAWIPYSFRHPAMQEMWRLYREGKLAGPALALLAPHRPPEELYDTRSDPWELDNLAEHPDHQDKLRELREAMEAWRARYGDLGEIDEANMKARWWPGGTKPQTARPIAIPLHGPPWGSSALNDGDALPAPVPVMLHCATQGAAMHWTTDDPDAGEESRWHYYAGGPLRFDAPGPVTLRFQAARIGYEPSEQVVRQFTVKAEEPR